MTKIYFILIFLISFVTVYAQNESDSAQVTAQTEMPQSAAVQTFPTKTEADSAYIRNDFAASVEMYENILKNEGESSDIYYNLGNSYYKMNNIAKAVLNYERALLLNPGNSDIRFNLELARSKTVDKVIPSSKMFFVTWTQSLINTMSEKAWAHTGHHHVYSDDIGTVFIYFRKTSSLEESRIYFSNLFLSSDYFSKYICLRTKI